MISGPEAGNNSPSLATQTGSQRMNGRGTEREKEQRVRPISLPTPFAGASLLTACGRSFVCVCLDARICLIDYWGRSLDCCAVVFKLRAFCVLFRSAIHTQSIRSVCMCVLNIAGCSLHADEPFGLHIAERERGAILITKVLG